MKRNRPKELGRGRLRAAYTLIEILVVVAIVAVLFALVLPVYASAKNKAKTTQDMSDLHQLGIAGALYHDSSGQWPLSTPTLIMAGLAPKEIVASKQDPLTNGQANELASRYPKEYPRFRQGPTDYRRTYLGPWDYTINYGVFEKSIQEQPAAGWLVDMVGHDADYPSPYQSRPEKGNYLRLTLDGAVVSRSYRWFRKASGEEVLSPEMRYADGDAAWIDSLLR